MTAAASTPTEARQRMAGSGRPPPLPGRRAHADVEKQASHMAPLATAERRVRDLIEFTAALVDVGLHDLARRSRVVARDLLEVLAELNGARGALAATTADRDRWRDQRWRETHGEPWPR
jgi:hypothetical protein